MLIELCNHQLNIGKVKYWHILDLKSYLYQFSTGPKDQLNGINYVNIC